MRIALRARSFTSLRSVTAKSFARSLDWSAPTPKPSTGHPTGPRRPARANRRIASLSETLKHGPGLAVRLRMLFPATTTTLHRDIRRSQFGTFSRNPQESGGTDPSRSYWPISRPSHTNPMEYLPFLQSLAAVHAGPWFVLAPPAATIRRRIPPRCGGSAALPPAKNPRPAVPQGPRSTYPWPVPPPYVALPTPPSGCPKWLRAAKPALASFRRVTCAHPLCVRASPDLSAPPDRDNRSIV